MTRAEMVSMVRSYIGRTDKDELIIQHLNWALRDLARIHDWPELLTSDTELITLPGERWVHLHPEVRLLVSVRVDGDLLDVVTFRDIDRAQTSATPLTGRPILCAYLVNSTDKALQFYPVPNSRYPIEVYYYKWPEPLDSDDSESELKDLDDVLVFNATMRMYMSLQMYEDMAVFKREFGEAANNAIQMAKRSPARLGIMRQMVEPSPRGDAAQFNPLVRKN